MKKLLLSALLLSATLSSSVYAQEGAALYAKCVTCHGAGGEKVALGKSKIIKDMSVDELVTSMKGYQDGTYGGAQKGLMKNQMKNFDDTQIKLLAEYISKK
ncbi:MAG: cytochrome c [Sulfuricurvum sp.]